MLHFCNNSLTSGNFHSRSWWSCSYTDTGIEVFCVVLSVFCFVTSTDHHGNTVATSFNLSWTSSWAWTWVGSCSVCCSCNWNAGAAGGVQSSSISSYVIFNFQASDILYVAILQLSFAITHFLKSALVAFFPLGNWIGNSVSSGILFISVQSVNVCHWTLIHIVVSILAHESFMASDLDFWTAASLKVWILSIVSKNVLLEFLSTNSGITCCKNSSHNLVNDQSQLKYGFNQLTVVLNNIVQINCLSSIDNGASFILFWIYSDIVNSWVDPSLLVTLILFLNHAFLLSQNLDFLSQKTSLLSDVIQSLSHIVNAIRHVFAYTKTVSFTGSHVVHSTISFSTVFVALIGIITFSFLVLIFGAI